MQKKLFIAIQLSYNVLGKTHIKKKNLVFGPLNGWGGGKPPDHLSKNQPKNLDKRKNCQNPFQAILRLKKEKKCQNLSGPTTKKNIFFMCVFP